MTSTELVTDIFNGDRNAEARLVQQFSRQVLYILIKRCGDQDLARDICQETFLVLIEKLRRRMLDDPEKLTAYIQQTAVNILIANRRKEARRQTFADTELIDACIDSTYSPVSEIERRHIRKSVRDSILNLNNARDKEILYRYYIYEHDKDYICQQMDIDFRHFDKVISRARNRLRDKIGGADPADLQQVSE